VNPSFRKVLYWAPRLLCIAFILFLASFSLHVFDEYLDLWPTAVAVLTHLVPSFIFAVVLMFAWRWEWVGALLFSTFAIYYGVTNLRHLSWVLTISAPLLVVGLLFLMSWLTHEPAGKINTKELSLAEKLEAAEKIAAASKFKF
jgi:ABC-type microcin C transport system permease subunit YejB